MFLSGGDNAAEAMALIYSCLLRRIFRATVDRVANFPTLFVCGSAPLRHIFFTQLRHDDAIASIRSPRYKGLGGVSVMSLGRATCFSARCLRGVVVERICDLSFVENGRHQQQPNSCHFYLYAQSLC